MLKVVKAVTDGALKASLQGIVDESVDLAKLVGIDFTSLELNCREVTRINSLGVREWRTYFHRLRCDAVSIRFVELSPVLVTSLCVVSHMVEPAEIHSICAPFQCTSCSKTSLVVFGIEQLKALDPVRRDLAPVPCQECGKPASFDDYADEYFSFLEK